MTTTPVPPATDWTAHPAYVWDHAGVRAVTAINAPPLALLKGIDAQKAAVIANVARLASGAAAVRRPAIRARGSSR